MPGACDPCSEAIAGNCQSSTVRFTISEADQASFVSSLKMILRRALLGASWVVCATPPEHRGRLLSELRLNPRLSGYNLTWHELIAGRAIVLILAIIFFVAFGSSVGRTLSDLYPAFPQNIDDVVFSWIVPEVLSFLTVFLLLFAVFADRPRVANGEKNIRKRKPLTRLFLVLIFGYVCAFGVRLWLSLSAMESSPWEEAQEKAVILAFSSVGTACVVLMAQKIIAGRWAGAPSRRVWTIAGVVLSVVVIEIGWSFIITKIAVEDDKNLKDEYQVFFACFAVYIALSGVIGAIASKIDYESIFSRWISSAGPISGPVGDK